jgi:hypothetical protein
MDHLRWRDRLHEQFIQVVSYSFTGCAHVFLLCAAQGGKGGGFDRGITDRLRGCDLFQEAGDPASARRREESSTGTTTGVGLVADLDRAVFRADAVGVDPAWKSSRRK